MAKLASICLILTISWLVPSTLGVYARKQVPSDAAVVHDLCGGREKVVHLRLFVQDLRIGNKNATVVEVAKADVTDKHPFNFGSVHVLDDLVTEGPELNSPAVGRVQGLTTNADLNTYGIAMNLNFYFYTGWNAGSTLSILGRNQVLDDKRELPVVGGTGVFRFTRGYAIQTSYSMDAASSYAVLEYNIYTTYNARLTENNADIQIAHM